MREHKGKSIIALISDYVAIDLETTGLSPEYDEIIEIACIRYRNGAEAEVFQTLVRPENMELVDDFITKLTGITQDMLWNAPKIESVLPEALNFIGQDVVIGHNASFDVNFIYDNAARTGLPPFANNYIDTRRLCRKAFPDFLNYRLKTLVKEFSIPTMTAHRAEADARQTALCYAHISRHISTNNLFHALAQGHKDHKLKAAEIIGDASLHNEDSPLFGKVVVFTGALEKMQRKEAMQIVANLGGINGDGITKKTNFLILGNNDMCKSVKDGKSTKQKKAEQYILAGADLTIIDENVFYDMIGEETELVESDALAQHNSVQLRIPSNSIDLSDAEQKLLDKISQFLSHNSHFSNLRIEERSSNYRSLCLGYNDFLRFKFTPRSKWISLRLPSHIAKNHRENPLFAAQKNKAQLHWKAEIESITDLDKFEDLIVASCVE